MSTTLPTTAPPRLKADERLMAIELLAERRRRQASAGLDHILGIHVGADPDEVLCWLCEGPGGDMPVGLLGQQKTRAEYLEQNIAVMATLMRIRSDLREFEALDPTE